MSALPAKPDSLPDNERSVLERFVDQTKIYETTGVPLPDSMLHWAAAGGAAMVLAAITAAIWPSPDSIHGGGFIIVGDATLANFLGILKSVVVPLLVGGLGILGTAAYLATSPRPRAEWHVLCVVELVLGVGSLAASALVLVVIAINVLIWIVIASFLLAALGVLIAGLGGG